MVRRVEALEEKLKIFKTGKCCENSILFVVSKAFLFLQVDAMLLRFVPRVTPLIDAPFVVVEQVVKANFSEKRKTIRNSLR